MLFGFGKEKENIEALKKAHQEQINKMNTYFEKERKEIREKNNTHWELKLKSTVMNFEKLFNTINSNLQSPEARKACIKTFNKIINNSFQNSTYDNLATRQ